MDQRKGSDRAPSHGPALTAPKAPGKIRARRSARKWRRTVAGGVVGLAVLWALALAGGGVERHLHLTLPGPVIGLALLAAIFISFKRWHTRAHRRLTLHLTPAGRTLVSHMGLLFVPAGAGIIAEGATLKQEWLPLIAGLAGSTIIGLVATGWLMHRFAPKIKKS